jgi:hypothetical protein
VMITAWSHRQENETTGNQQQTQNAQIYHLNPAPQIRSLYMCHQNPPHRIPWLKDVIMDHFLHHILHLPKHHH